MPLVNVEFIERLSWRSVTSNERWWVCMSVRARLTVIFTALFGAIVIALAVSLYFLEKSEAYKRLDTALETAASATSMSAEHELNENLTQRAGERGPSIGAE